MPSTTGTGTLADPFVTEWESGGDTFRISSGKGTTPNDQDVIDAHRDAVDAALAIFPEDP